MRVMKDSGVEWIGEIPADWEIARLKNFVQIKSGEFISKENYSDHGKYSIIGSNGEIGKTDELNNVNQVITTGRVGSIGTVYIVEKAWITDNVLILENIDIFQKYLYYMIPNFDFNFISSGTAQPLITATKLKNQFFAFPPLPTQQRIANYLDRVCLKIDTIIEKEEQIIEKLKAYRQSLITEAVTKGLYPDAPMKASGIEWIGEIPEHWEIQKIKHLSPVKRGASPRPIDDQKYFDDINGEFAWVRIADVSASDRYLLKTKETLSELGASLSVKRYPGDFFISIAGSVGKPIITKIKCCIHDGFVWFPSLKINPEYLYYIFMTGLPYQGLGKLGTQLNLNTETIGLITIPLPPINEIEKIIKFLDTKCIIIDETINGKEALIEKLGQYKKSIIYEVVTGKKEV